jgi:hypothetical protein
VPFDLPLPTSLRNARWKVKIRDKERREPPHVTILRGTVAWRIDLRTGAFMDQQPDAREVPEALLDHIRQAATWKTLSDEWDRRYPANPVDTQEYTEAEDHDGNQD